jgi:hypothetical protein
MREQSQVRFARLPVPLPRPRWPAWVRLTIERRRHARVERLESIERLAHERRRARKSGPVTPSWPERYRR